MATKRKDKSRVVLKTGEVQRKDGTYQFSWQDSQMKRRFVYARTLDDLREKEKRIQKDKCDGIKTEARYTTIDELFDLWANMKRGLKDNTFENYKYMYNTFVRPVIGSKRISTLKKSDIKKYYNYLVDERNLKPSTIDNIHTVLHQVLQIAVDDDFIRNNPSDNVLRELKKAHCFQSEKRRALTKPEQELFLNFLKTHPVYEHWYPVFAVMIGTGLRVGEVTGLRWCDIDMESGMIDVNHKKKSYRKSTIHQSEPKNKGLSRFKRNLKEFALFLPPLESGDTVQTVTSAYVQEFNRDVNTKVNEHTGYDLGELVYVDYEGMEENPSNYYDIMAVYMVKHGVGDTATVMNDTSKGWLQAVVNDMCSYTTSTGTKDVEETDADGNVTTVTKSVLYVNVTLKSYRDMISVYGFNSDHVEMLEQIMSPEFMGQLGYAGSGSGGGGGSPGVSSMTEDEINAILNEITDSRRKTVCSYALHRVGFPYSQDLRDSGNYYDCSSLAYYSWKDAGVDISYGGATTAAAEAQGLDEAGKTVAFDELQPGDLIFYSFTSNGRYKNISHVAVYVGNGKVVEALNESLGVVYRDVASTGKIVVIGRP